MGQQHKTAMDDVGGKGEFVRKDAVFRSWISAEPDAQFPPEKDRYRLYVSLACPWAHRTLIVRELMGLQDVIDVRVVDWHMDDMGWKFPSSDNEVSGATREDLYGFSRIRELYFKASPDYGGRFTVPVLWDKKTETIVSNESKEIIVMLSRAFGALQASNAPELFPDHRADEITRLAEHLYTINNGVYKCGFARSQEAYEQAFDDLFERLEEAESILAKSRYLLGDQLTLADVRLWTTLVRFDPVYVGHFKCNKKRLRDYPNLWNYTLELYQMDAFRETTNLTHIKNHYYVSHPTINPFGIVPRGPDVDYDAPHDREQKFPTKAE